MRITFRGTDKKRDLEKEIDELKRRLWEVEKKTYFQAPCSLFGQSFIDAIPMVDAVKGICWHLGIWPRVVPAKEQKIEMEVRNEVGIVSVAGSEARESGEEDGVR